MDAAAFLHDLLDLRGHPFVPRREVVDKRVSPQVEQVMEDRRSVQTDQPLPLCDGSRSEERRVGKECGS